MRRLLGLAVTIYSLYWLYQRSGPTTPQPVLATPPLTGSQLFTPPSSLSAQSTAVHYAPRENLEQLDLSALRASTGPLEIAMYAFTDRPIAAQLITLADAGRTVYLYRDGEQFEREEQAARASGVPSTTGMFRNHANIHIQVKVASSSALMHLKCWTDGSLLRCGSANWSPAGLQLQDNDARYTADSQQINTFAQIFRQAWDRSTNTTIQ